MYGKLYDTIFGSSIMEEDVEIRYIWMCMLAVADRDGFVDQTIPALARRFNIAEDLMNKSIEIFLSPDPSSRTQDHAGKRLEPIRESFGWKIINYEKYRDMKNEDERREYMKTYMRTYRKSLKKPPVNNCKQQLTKLAYTDTDTDTDTEVLIAQSDDTHGVSEDEIFLTISLNDNSEYPITKTQVKEFQKLYPSVVIEQAFRDIKGWNLSNPGRRKTKSGILRHINSWLSKEQNKGRVTNGEKEKVW